MNRLLKLWNDLTDDQKWELKKQIEEDLKDIKFWKTHQVVGEPGKQFIISNNYRNFVTIEAYHKEKKWTETK